MLFEPDQHHFRNRYDSATLSVIRYYRGVGMAVLNIRLPEQIRDQLREMANDAGVTLSEFARDLLTAAVVPAYEREAEHGEEPAPESMPILDRQILSMLHRILARVLPKDANDVDGDRDYQLMRARILESGYTGAYWYETAGFSTELSKRDCDRISDLLQMFRTITYSIENLAKEGRPVDEILLERLEFAGFDHNDPLESHIASYVDFLMRDDRWTELRPQLERNDNGNSHSPMLGVYGRMLSEYRRIMDGRERGYSHQDYLLSLNDLRQVAEARVHPATGRTREIPAMEHSQVPLPEDQYLTRIGEVAYTVSYLEWTILGDLHRLSDQLPDELVLKAVEPLETSGIGAAVKKASTAVEPGPIKDYLVGMYRALFAASKIRNDVLHARPATHPSEGQRLNRAEVQNKQTTGKRFWIDDAWFDTSVSNLNEILAAAYRVRPPIRATRK